MSIWIDISNDPQVLFIHPVIRELQKRGNDAHMLHVNETEDDFIRYIGAAIQDHAPLAIEARLAIAQEYMWDRRAAAIDHALNPLLSQVDPVQRKRPARLDTETEKKIDGELRQEANL